MPLEQVALPLDEKIVSLESSCDCVQPRLVQYFADRQRTSQALLLEFVAEVPTTGIADEASLSDVQPVHLGVIIEVRLADGKKRDFTVNLLYSVLHQNEHFPSATDDRRLNSKVSSFPSVGEQL